MKRLYRFAITVLAACITTGAGAGVFGEDSAAKPVKVALVLPFNVSSGSEDVNYMDFYAGTLLAAKKLKENGEDITLKVMDINEFKRSEDRDSLFADFSLIIGPVACRQQEEVVGIYSTYDIPIISPMDQESAVHIDGNNCFFQIPASLETQIDNLVESVENGPEGPVTVFYSNATESDRKWMDLVEKALEKRAIAYEKTTYDVHSGRVIFERFGRTMALPEGKTNKVIIASENVAFASDVVRNMALIIHSGIPVSVYGSPRLRNLNTIDSEVLYTVNFHTSTPYFVDYEDEATIAFIHSFRDYFDAEPTPYAFQGYDILTYFAGLICEMGSNFRDFIEYYPMDLLQNSFRMKQKESEKEEIANGFYNSATRCIEYTPDGRTVIRKF